MIQRVHNLAWRIGRLMEFPSDLAAAAQAGAQRTNWRGYFFGKYLRGLVPSRILDARRDGAFLMTRPDAERVVVRSGDLRIACPLSLNSPGELRVMAKDIFSDNVYRLDLLEPGSVALDCGANVGMFACAAASVLGCGGQLCAWEPLGAACRALRANAATNGLSRVKCIEKALGAGEGVGRLYVADGESGSATLCAGRARGAAAREVQLTTIDAEVQRLGLKSVDYIKMDVEGHEKQVLRGAAATIRRFRPTLAVAAYHERTDWLEIPRLVRRLEPGYRISVRYYRQSAYVTAHWRGSA